MDSIEILTIISKKEEDSKVEFKSYNVREQSLAQEMIAFSNSGGGLILIGVSDDGTIEGLTVEILKEKNLDNRISNAIKNHIKPPIAPKIENVPIGDNKIVIAITIQNGQNKPYMDNQGNVFVRRWQETSRVIAPEELKRLFQLSRNFYADEQITKIPIASLDLSFFSEFFEKRYEETLDKTDTPLLQLLENMNLAKSGFLNLSGALLFAKQPQYSLPNFIVKAIAFTSGEIDVDNYIDSKDIKGKLSDIFQQTISFLMINVGGRQVAQGINTEAIPKIPKIVFEELVANALIHRDYFIASPIKVLIFNDRVELISPGHLPNNLTVENIKLGVSNIRNPALASYATKILPYRGLGSGIMRSLKAHPDICFIDDRENNQFKAIIQK